jgi:hypothetical protein
MQYFKNCTKIIKNRESIIVIQHFTKIYTKRFRRFSYINLVLIALFWMPGIRDKSAFHIVRNISILIASGRIKCLANILKFNKAIYLPC